MKRILFLSLINLLFLTSWGGVTSTTFNFQYTAKATGNGTVYAATSDVFNPSRVEDMAVTSASHKVVHRSDQTYTKTDRFIYLDALPDTGYGFKQWRKVDANGTTLTAPSGFGMTRKSNIVETINTSGSVFYYEADFEPTMVSVSSESPALCQVFIDKEINKIGDKVTLIASTSSNCSRITWKKNGVAVSNSNPLVVDVTEKAHYTATATKVTSYLANGFYRLVNVASEIDDNKDYARLSDNWFDMHSLCAARPNPNPNNYPSGIPGVQVNAPFYSGQTNSVLKRDLVILTDNNKVYSDPSSIVYINRTNNTEYELYSQGTHVKEITSGKYYGSITITFTGTNVNIVRAGDIYSVYAAVNMNEDLMGTSYSIDFGKFYFSSKNREFSTDYTDDDCNSKWRFEPVDGEANYLTPDFSKGVQANGKYYTTMRLPFNCEIVSNDLKAYSVTGYPASGDMTTLAEKATVYSAGEKIPAGLPVVIENSNNTPELNKLKPVDTPIDYISSSATNSEGITSNISTVLYNKYGTHTHDNHGDQVGRGDSIGYLSQTYKAVATAPLYKLGLNENGVVGFWTAVANGEQISGNQAYATQQCALFPKEVELNELPTIADQITYKVIEPLTVAYVDATNKVIYAKDDNGAPLQEAQNGEIDFMAEHFGNDTYIDHSNWVAIDASSVVIPDITQGRSRIDITGKVMDSSPNRRMKATAVVVKDNEGDFIPNTYCVVNFNGSHYQIGQSQYFFAAPLANEIAKIIWAQWDGNDTFVVPSGTGFSGTLNADFDLYNDGDYILKPGSQYQFIGLVNKLTSKDSNYKVYPLYGLKDMTITGIQSVETSGNVVSVKYYNMMGVESDVPFNGINIVVTTYDNGTRTTSKILK